MHKNNFTQSIGNGSPALSWALVEQDDKDAQEPSEEARIALCLSGGGFRASLFHLGAIRCLNERGILSRVDTIVSVSGGSILAAHLANVISPWPTPGEVFGNWEARVSTPFRAFVGRDLRTWPILARYFPPWNVFRPSIQTKVLARRYETRLNPQLLVELPERPRFVFCATDMVFGVNWIFERSRIGDFVAGYCEPGKITIGQAVAASSCFPPVFQPMPMDGSALVLRRGRFPNGVRRDSLLKGLSLTDGGVYDNMGLEPAWKNHKIVFVSDGGASFQFQLSRTPVKRLLRYNGIIGDQASKIRRRWLMSLYVDKKFGGSFWSVSSAVDNYDPGAPGYSTAFAKEIIARIRTDMDAFSEGEAKVLENHGFTLADASLRCHTPHLLKHIDPLGEPYPEWANERLAKTALKHSHERRSIGRFMAREHSTKSSA